MRRIVVAVVLALATATAASRPYDEVVALRDRGEVSQAFVQVEAALAGHADDRELLLVRADLLYLMNRLTEARATLEHALRLGEPSAGWLALYGRILVELGDDAAARAPLERALALDPANAEARDQLAMVGRLALIRRPGSEPPADSPPARVVDELVALAGSGQLGYALLEHLDPEIFRRLEARAGGDQGPPSLRDYVAEHVDEKLGEQRRALGEILGYRIGDVEITADRAWVTIEIASVVPFTAADLGVLRAQIAESSAADVLGVEVGQRYDRLAIADRERFVAEYLGRREVRVEELVFELHRIGERWMIADVRFTEGGIGRSFVGELETAVGLSAGIARGLADAMARHAPPTGWHWLDVTTLAATVLVLGWLAATLALPRRPV